MEFVTTDAPAPRPPPSTTTPRPPSTPVETIAWATYGYDDRRTRFASERRLRPPFRRIWTFRGRALLEFPPAVPTGALPAHLRRPLLRARRPHRQDDLEPPHQRCGWASPAVCDGSCTSRSSGDARRAATRCPGTTASSSPTPPAAARVVWQRTTGLNESSPLVSGGLVYVGDWDGVVWALDARTGRTRWIFRADGRIKGSLALSGGRVFVGDYDGHLYALDARTGRLAWRASAQPRLGGRGAFYSTPAVGYGRVFIGNTDGKVYAFGAPVGAALVAEHGSYVYASPAIWRRLSSSARTTSPSMRSTRRPATCAGGSARTGRSRARPP